MRLARHALFALMPLPLFACTAVMCEGEVRPLSQVSFIDEWRDWNSETEILEVQAQLHQQVWGEATELRKSGQLLALGQQIQCPVVAIHGDYDPHPAQGVEQPLTAVLTDFRFILLRNCGHLPWLEREARDKFYEILTAELRAEQ